MKNRKKLVYSSVISIVFVSLLGFLLIYKTFFNNQEYKVPVDNNILESDESVSDDNSLDIVPNEPDKDNLPSDSGDSSDDYISSSDSNTSDNDINTKPNDSNGNTTIPDKKPSDSNNNSVIIQPSQDNKTDNNQANNITKPNDSDKPIITEPEPQKPITLKEKVESMSLEEKNCPNVNNFL